MKASSVNQVIGKRIGELRAEQGYGVEDFACKIGCSSKQLIHVEAGLTRLSAGVFLRISEVLQLPMEAFFPPHENSDIETISEETLDNLKAELKGFVDAISTPGKLATAKFVLKRLAAP